MKITFGINMVAVAAVLICLTGCAKTTRQSSENLMDKVLAAWMRENHSDRVDARTESGAYIINFEQGTGAVAGASSYVLVHYSKSSLSGDISDTNREEIAEQLGTKDIKTYYGSDIWQLGQNLLPFGIEEVLKGVRAGADIEIALPLSASRCPIKYYNAFSTDITDNVIFEMHVDEVVDDINAYQQWQIEEYRNLTYPGLDSLSDGFYFKSFGREEATDSIADGAKIKVRYVGRLLNGQVFDTNIEDTARHYRIYDSGTDYGAFELTYYEELDQMLENNNCIPGFGMAVHRMDYTEKAETFFLSTLGYGAAGSKTSIPEYAPLRFELYIEGEEE